jgi:hypothetical protein
MVVSDGWSAIHFSNLAFTVVGSFVFSRNNCRMRLRREDFSGAESGIATCKGSFFSHV